MANSMKGHQPRASVHVSWVTPRWVLDPLGEFDLDPCTPHQMPWETAKRRYTRFDDGLLQDWAGRVWLNPPFNEISRWAFLKKMAEHGNGIALLAASTETEWFRTWVWPFATSILFLKSRPFFHRPDGERGPTNSGCSMCLVGYGSANDAALETSNLGQFLRIRSQQPSAA